MRALPQTKSVVVCLMFFLGFVSAQVYSQTQSNPPNSSNEEQTRRAESLRRETTRIQDDIFKRARADDAPTNLPGKPPVRKTPEEAAEIAAKSKEDRENFEKATRMLAPPAHYYREFAEELKDRKTDLARIFVDQNCDAGQTVSLEEIERCADVIPVKGGGSFYSFRFGNNFSVTNNKWDIHFIDNNFVVGNETVQGIIAKAGDVELKTVSKLPQAKFIFDYEPKKTQVEIKEQSKVLKQGIKIKGITYSNRVPAELNQTYVLRSIAYRLKGEPEIDLADMSRGTGIDATIAFKVVGRENDGSIIILWKRLKVEIPRRVLNDGAQITK